MHRPFKGKSPHITANNWNLIKCMQTCAALEILLSASRYSPEQWKPVGSWNGMINVSKHIPVDYKILALIRSTCEAVSPVCVRACVRVHVHRGHIFEVILFFFFSFFLLCHVFFFSQISRIKEKLISFPAASEGLRLVIPCALCQNWGELEGVCCRRFTSITVPSNSEPKTEHRF